LSSIYLFIYYHLFTLLLYHHLKGFIQILLTGTLFKTMNGTANNISREFQVWSWAT